MAYLAVGDFKYGMDRRRPQATGVPGTLWLLKNAVISRGGDIERAKKFAAAYTLPAGTFGLASLNGQLYTFGSAVEPAGMPDDVQYQRLLSGIPGLPVGNTYDMVRVYDARAFDGKLYVIAGYANGGVYHFYNGTKVTAWDTLAGTASTHATVAARLARLINESPDVQARARGSAVFVTARVPGVTFTSSTSTTDNTDTPGVTLPTLVSTTLQANVAAVSEVRASGTVTVTGGSAGDANQITGLTVAGVDVLGGVTVPWSGSNNDTAVALVVAINDQASVHGYDATVSGGNVVTLRAAGGLGATANGRVVAVATSGAVTASKTDFADGVTKVEPVRRAIRLRVGSTTYNGVNSWTATINGIDYRTNGYASATALASFVQKNRVWAPVGSLFRYCKLNDPTDWTDTNASSGAGFINIGTQTEGALELIGAAAYEGRCAIFSRTAIVLYNLAADAQLITVHQVIDNTGSMAARSIVQYGANDVYYLDDTGIRSLRSREGFDAAYASDIGSAIDPFIQDVIKEAVGRDLVKAQSVIDGTDGRYMLAIGNRIVMLSYFPSSKITAWSYIDFGQTVDDLVRADRDVYLRAGNTIYAYGGLDGATYPSAGEFPALAVTPFMSAQDPASQKQLQSYDHIASNVWRVRALVDPNDTSKTVDLGRLTGVTNNQMAAWFPGHTSLFALEYTCDVAGFASLSATATHYNTGEKQ